MRAKLEFEPDQKLKSAFYSEKKTSHDSLKAKFNKKNKQPSVDLEKFTAQKQKPAKFGCKKKKGKEDSISAGQKIFHWFSGDKYLLL